MFDQANFVKGGVCPLCGYVVSLIHYSESGDGWAVECMRSDHLCNDEKRECEFIVWGRTPDEARSKFLSVPNV